jgi:hypothetical protein
MMIRSRNYTQEFGSQIMFATPNAINEGVSSKSPDRTSPIRNIRGSFKFKHGVLGNPIVRSP